MTCDPVGPFEGIPEFPPTAALPAQTLRLDRPLLPFSIRSYHLTPYVSGEAFYLSQYEKWSTTALYAGCLLPLGKHVGLDPYYEHQNVTSKNPNQQLNQFGLILNIYFWLRRRPARGDFFKGDLHMRSHQ